MTEPQIRARLAELNKQLRHSACSIGLLSDTRPIRAARCGCGTSAKSSKQSAGN